jgi:hypothetical protein
LLQDGVQGWSVKTQGTPVNQPPVVVDVSVAGSAWQQVFNDQFVGGAFVVPDGANQLSPLPWSGLNQIKIRFSEDVNLQAANLAVNGVSVLNYAAGGFSGFAFDPATDVATWTLTSPINRDKIRLTLDDAATDLGGLALDGEWINSTSTFSGNGTAGGDFSFRFDVLPADVNQSAAVDSGDLRASLDRQFTAAGQANYDPRFDLDGNGAINILDWAAVRDRIGTTLPTGAPSPSAAPEAAAPEAVVVADARPRASAVRLSQAAVDRAIAESHDPPAAASIASIGRALRARRTKLIPD